MSLLKRFLKDTIIYGLATVLPRLMGIILVRLHTDVLPTEGYADVTAFYVGAAFLNVILTYGMETAFFRFFSINTNKHRVYSTSLIALTLSTLGFGLLLYILQESILQVLELPKHYFWYLAGVVLLDTLVVAPFAYLRARGKALQFTGLKMVNLITFVLLNFFFLWAIPKFGWHFSWYQTTDLRSYIFIANLCASLATLLFIIPQFFSIKWIFDWAIFKALWNYGWPIMIAGLAFVVNEQLDKLFVNAYQGKIVGGAYAGCYKLAVFMTIFIQAFRLGAEPFFFNHAQSKNAPQTYATILKYFVIVGCLGLLIIIFGIDILKGILIKNTSYHIALNIVPIVVLANLCLGIYHNLSIWYKLTNKTIYGMYFSLIGAGITILFNLIMLPKIGFIAAAWATLIAYGSMMLISFLVGRRKYPIPYDLNRILCYLLLSTTLSLVSFNFYRGDHHINAILLLLFLALVILLEKKEILKIFKK